MKYMRSFLLLLFLQLASSLLAQKEHSNPSPPVASAETNRLSILAGPNWLDQGNSNLTGGSSRNSRIGYTLGLDFSRRMLGEHWQFKLGLRYNVWRSIAGTGFLTWPSEFSTGVYIYDPTLPHYLQIDVTEKAWQYFAGLRWLPGKPRHLRWYGDVEIGATDFIQAFDLSDKAIRFTLGLGFGLEWKPAQHFALFVQPQSRYVFRANTYSSGFLPVQVESGVRWVF